MAKVDPIEESLRKQAALLATKELHTALGNAKWPSHLVNGVAVGVRDSEFYLIVDDAVSDEVNNKEYGTEAFRPDGTIRRALSSMPSIQKKLDSHLEKQLEEYL